MATITRIPRPQRRAPTIARVGRPVAVAHAPRRVVVRTPTRATSALHEGFLPDIPSAVPASEFETDPYVDYARLLTAEGGILLIYKDLDERWRHTVWRLFAWWLFTGIEAWLALRHLDPVHPWVTFAGLAAAGILNAVIVAKPVELYRRIEIRPDGMIIEGQEVFWQRHMDGGWPTLRPAGDGGQVLTGIYGTRFVEFLTIRRFDEHDRMPEIFAAHLHAAMEQLWTQPT